MPDRTWLSKAGDHFRSIFDTEATGRLVIYSPLVGVVAGLGACAFFFCLDLLRHYAQGELMGYFPPPAGGEAGPTYPIQLPTHWWAVLLVPTVGGLLCGWLVYTFAPEAEGHGTDAMVKSFHFLGGKIRARVPFIKTLASIITIGTGGSAGREGPIAQIGAGFGSFLADRLGLSERERRLLVISGGAGGIGAIFRAPLGGALFVSEVLYSSTALEFAAVIPCFIASITAYMVFTAVYGHGHVFTTPPELTFGGVWELPFYVVFAFLCALVGYIYVRFFYGLRDYVFRPIPIPNHFKPAIGGLALGGMLLLLPQLMSGGYGWIQLAINGDTEHLTMGLIVLLCLGKIAATSLTISSGGSGGVFAPSLFIGAMLGAAYGRLCEHFFPGVIENPEVFVLVGMGGFFAGVAKVPLTAMLMVCEMSGSYELLVPLMLVSIINVAVLSSKHTLYEEQVEAIVDSPAHQGDFIVDVLQQLYVKDVLDTSRQIDLVPEDMTLEKILQMVSTSRNTYFPVIDRESKLTGIFSLRDLRSVLTGHRLGQLIVAADIATTPVLTLTPNDDLHTALRRFTQKNIDDIPVVEAKQPNKVIGMLSRRNLINAYHDRVTELQHHGEHGEDGRA